MEAEEVTHQHSYLLFELTEARYALPVERVFEILWLPELTPIAQVPFDIAGFFNLRVRIVTVIELNLRLGYKSERYRTTDKVVVMADGVSHDVKS